MDDTKEIPVAQIRMALLRVVKVEPGYIENRDLGDENDHPQRVAAARGKVVIPAFPTMVEVHRAAPSTTDNATAPSDSSSSLAKRIQRDMLP